MDEIPNNLISKYFMETVIKIISRRTSEEFTVYTLDSIITEYTQKYDFLKYIEINKQLYQENIERVEVNNEINTINKDLLGRAIDDIFDKFIKSLGDNIGFYFIREIRSDLDKEIGPIFQELDISYTEKQELYQGVLENIEKIKLEGISNSEIFNLTFSSLCKIINKKEIEDFNMSLIFNTMSKYEEKYDFLKLIKIAKHPHEEYYFVKINPEIEKHTDIERGRLIEDMISDIGRKIEITNRSQYIKYFKNKLTQGELKKLEKIGIKFDKIHEKILKEEFELIISKIFSSIITMLRSKNSNEQIIEFIDILINKAKEKHSVLDNVKINKTEQINEFIAVDSNINNVNSREFAKAIRDLLFITQDMQKSYSAGEFIDLIKIELGEETIFNMDKIGINMHLIEMRAGSK